MSPQSCRLFHESSPKLCLSLQKHCSCLSKAAFTVSFGVAKMLRCTPSVSHGKQDLHGLQRSLFKFPGSQGGFTTQHLPYTTLSMSSVANIFVSFKWHCLSKECIEARVLQAYESMWQGPGKGLRKMFEACEYMHIST